MSRSTPSQTSKPQRNRNPDAVPSARSTLPTLLPFVGRGAEPTAIAADPVLDEGYEELHFLDQLGQPLVITCYTLDRWYRVPPSARPPVRNVGRAFVVTITDGPPVVL